MERIKAALVGLGFMGPIHIEALRRIGGVDITAIADSDLEKAEKAARHWGIPRWYGSYKELLEQEDFDILHNCTPNHLHFEINAAALRAGRHIFSEKPLAVNTTQSKELVALAKKHGKVNAVGYNYRYNSLVREIHHRIAGGIYGKVLLAHGSYLQDWLLLDTDYNWRVEGEQCGDTRAVSDIGSHWSDMIQYLTGSRIARVMANLKTIVPVRKKPLKPVDTFSGTATKTEEYTEIPITNDDCGFVMFELDSGVCGQFMVSQVSAGRKCYFNFEIDCEQASISWNQENPEQAFVGRRNRENELLIKDPALMGAESIMYVHSPAGHPEGYLDGVKNMLLCIYNHLHALKEGKISAGGPVDFPTFADAHNVMLVCEAVARSNREKRWIELEYS